MQIAGTEPINVGSELDSERWRKWRRRIIAAMRLWRVSVLVGKGREESYGNRRAKAKITIDFLDFLSCRFVTRKMEMAKRASSEIMSNAATICQRRIWIWSVRDILPVWILPTIFGPQFVFMKIQGSDGLHAKATMKMEMMANSVDMMMTKIAAVL